MPSKFKSPARFIQPDPRFHPVPGHLEAVGIDERSQAPDQLDPIALQLMLEDFRFVLHHMLDGQGQVRRHDIRIDRIGETVDAALPEAREIENGLPESLAGDGSGVNAGSSHLGAGIHQCHLFPELGRLDGRMMSGRASPYDRHIEAEWRIHRFAAR